MNRYDKVLNRFSRMLYQTGLDNSENEGKPNPSYNYCRICIRKDKLSFDDLLKEKNVYMYNTGY